MCPRLLPGAGHSIISNLHAQTHAEDLHIVVQMHQTDDTSLRSVQVMGLWESSHGGCRGGCLWGCRASAQRLVSRWSPRATGSASLEALYAHCGQEGCLRGNLEPGCWQCPSVSLNARF